MKIELDNGTLFVNQRVFCHAKISNETRDLRPGIYSVVIGTAFHLDGGPVLPEAVGLGWIGHLPGCDIILGHVLGRDGLLPSANPVRRLLALFEVAEDRGETVMLEVE